MSACSNPYYPILCINNNETTISRIIKNYLEYISRLMVKIICESDTINIIIITLSKEQYFDYRIDLTL